MFHLTSENAIRKIIYYAEWKETFTVPVTQAIRLEQGGVQLPTAIAGELGNMTLLCFIYLLNRRHLLEHLKNCRNAETELQSWCNDIKARAAVI